MKVKELTYAIKRGLPGFGSVSVGMSVTVEEGDDLQEVWGDMKKDCGEQCNEDPAWINEDMKRSEPEAKVCEVCGAEMTHKSGTSKTGKPWSGWFCSEKGHPPIWG